ncbi:hypothetical protein SFRURICE_004193 [Spodoptera frugiperda]|nr:hypothetical protein SFRURICE_004193 [Spodoptera frugiperda]
MALSYFNESEAPRDFRVSSTESDSHYKKCLLCYTVKKNFYCPDCVRAGNFVHSSMPYADRYAEKQGKLLRVKVNRKHVLDQCERLLANKLKRDTLVTEAKQSRDKLELLRLAIQQRRRNIEEKRRELTELRNYNNELTIKLPRYQKRVTSLGKHAEVQRMELENKEEPPHRPQLHIVAPWIHTDGDFSQVQAWLRQNKETMGPGGAVCAVGAVSPGARACAALALCAQLLALLSWALDARLPHTISLNEYSNWRVSEGGVARGARRLGAAGAWLAARAALLPPHPPGAAHPPHALAALHSLVVAANTDDPMLGRVESWTSSCDAAARSVWAEAIAALGDLDTDDTEPPEHLHWPEAMEMEELSCSPASPAPAPSLVTSAAASLASMWRVFTK